ncbi:hypothetical protein Cgig2_013884 [Carnegiea gigantea]|uniref:Uncharacterized protein n=1 Tax=Carnegiea gigantea TaxID=171969 RepID=A0A9Q1GGK9_9CARY|nr:hypothetical protein Cgig2_013884 [Carnegiea gigantea]
MKLGLLLKQHHPKSPVSLGALWTVWTRPNARAEQVRPRNSQVAMKEQMLCQDVGTICAGTSTYLFRISLITGCKGKRYIAIHLADGSFTVASGWGITKEYSAGKRYCFSRADLFSLVTALGSGKWLLKPSCGSERVGAPGNFDPSAMISVTGGVRPFRLGTELPGPNDDSVEELIEAPSEDKLLEECPEAELGEPDRKEVLELEEATLASGLRLCHPANLEVGHIVSYGDLPRVRHLHLRAKNVGGGGVLATRPRGVARLKKGNDIGNLFRLLILILSGDASHHPTINKGREVGELRCRPSIWGPACPSRTSPLDEQDDDIIYNK